MVDGKLTVANRAQGNSFNITVQGNVTIRNFKGHENIENPHEAKTVVKNGKVDNYYLWGNQDKATSERVLNLSSNNFSIFDKLRKLDKETDKKGKVLSQSDLEILRNNSKLQEELGVIVKYDAKEKVYGIYGGNNSKLYFDFE